MDNRLATLGITQTVAKQTQTKEFGQVMRDTLKGATSVASGLAGGLVGSLPGAGLVSAAVTAVTSVGSKATAVTGTPAGVQSVAPGLDTITGSSSMNDMMTQMRAEADRSIMVQMQMQQESRDYNTLSNVLKTRHDSAKAAINNIR